MFLKRILRVSVTKLKLEKVAKMTGNYSSTRSAPTPLLIDTDCGTDDAKAIMFAMSHPEKVQIVAVTTVSGNTCEANVYKNVKYILKSFGRSFPIYRGEERKDKSTSDEEVPFHGYDGLADMKRRKDDDDDATREEEDDLNRVASTAPNRKAASAIVKYANEFEGSLDVICLGPLTNLAAALREDPDLGKKLNCCTIMGGNTTGLGNSGVCSEKNFDFDPESAKFVLENFRCDRVRLVGWEICVSSFMPWKRWSEILEEASTPQSDLVLRMDTELPYRSESQFFADEVAMFCLLFGTEAVIDEELCVCTVETKGEFTSGMLVIDRIGKLKRAANCIVVLKIDVEKFWAEMTKMFRQPIL